MNGLTSFMCICFVFIVCYDKSNGNRLNGRQTVLENMQNYKHRDYKKLLKNLLQYCRTKLYKRINRIDPNATQLSFNPIKHTWIASIVYKGNHKIVEGCGGTLINARYVLTAAHCVDDVWLQLNNLKTYRIILGQKRLFSKSYKIESVFVHPQFDRFRLLHDIALIKLNKNVRFSNYVRPIHLPYKRVFKATDSLIMARSMTTNAGTITSIRTVKLAKISQEICTVRGVTLTAGQLCLKDINNTDICKGDSGKPIIIKNEHDAKSLPYQIGIMSYGFDKEKCGKGPSVVTYVPYYLEWIQSISRQ